MSGSGETPTTGNAQQPTYPGAVTYTRVPWLLVYTHGPGSEEVADQLSEQCAGRGVDLVDVRPVDEIRSKDDVDGYAVAVFVVSARSATSRDAKTKRLVESAMDLYRNRRLHGLGDVIAGRQRYAWAGVILLVVLDDPTTTEPGTALTALMDKACDVRHVRTGDAELPDLFEVFEGKAEVPPHASPTPRQIDHVEALWAEARAWGVGAPEEVHHILRLIDKRRFYYRTKKHHALGAQHPDHPDRGALDLALDHAEVWAVCPEGMSEADYEHRKSNFVITGSRAVRRTIEHVQVQYPNFSRPAGRAGTKYNRPAFRAIYVTLRALQRQLDARDAATRAD